MISRIITLGTSHTVPYHNSELDKVLSTIGIKVTNYGVSGLGIDTYFSRVLTATEKYKDEKLLFIIEIPSIGRYHEYPHKGYKRPWRMITEEFWNNSLEKGHYKEHYTKNIAYYSKTQILERAGLSKIEQKTLQRIKVFSNDKQEHEELLAKAISINGLIKNLGHIPLWFSFNNFTVNDPVAQQLMDSSKMNLINEHPVVYYICKKYADTETNLKQNPDIFPDGAHLNEKDWQEIAINIFLPKVRDYV